MYFNIRSLKYSVKVCRCFPPGQECQYILQLHTLEVFAEVIWNVSYINTSETKLKIEN